MQTVAKKLTLSDPENVRWTVSWAYAIRRADCIEAARRILINTAEQQEGEALLHFNRRQPRPARSRARPL